MIALAAAWNCGPACSDAAPHNLSSACSINTDCDSPLVCAFQRCHNACTDSRDCPAGLSCVSSDRPYRVCQLPDERSCTRTSDCPGTQLCAIDGNCHDACVTTADCVSRQVCVASACADPSELGANGQLVPNGDADVPALCSYNSECSDPMVCKNGVCQLECLTSRDCAHGESCQRNQCVTPGSAVVDGGTKAGAGGSGGASTAGGSGGAPSGGPGRDASAGELGAVCDYPSDCNRPLRCGPRGTCVYECSTTFDCAADQCCQDHRCVTGNACYLDAGIAPVVDAGAGAECSGDLECQDGIVCNGFERCTAGHCRPAAAAACDDGDPCTTDTCDEKNGSCAHSVTGPVDEDGDGHYAIGAACGASSARADDCDDHNANAYPGHPEICDEVDNNCNGIADEGVWQLGAVTRVTKSGVFPIGNAASTDTTPAVAAAGGGFTVLATGDGTTGEVMAFELDTAATLLGSSTLATSSGATCQTAPGNRVAYPGLASDGTNVLATFWKAEAQANTCCNDNAQFKRSALGILASADLSKKTNVQFDVDSESGCNPAAPTTRVGPPSPVWVPSLSRYVVAWGDSHGGSGARALVSTVTPAGALGGVQTVTADETAAAFNTAIFPQVISAASPTRVFVAFAASASLRMVLLDPASLSSVAGPVDLPNSFQTLPLAAAYSGGKFFLVHSTRGTFDVSAIDATTLKELRVASISVSSDSLYAPRLVPVGNGVFLVFSRNATRLSYGWAPASFDSAAPEVFPLTDVELGKPVSASGAAALDDKHVALAWVDGDVEAAVVSCGQ